MALFPAFKLDSFKTQLLCMGGAIGIGALASCLGGQVTSLLHLPDLIPGITVDKGEALKAFAGILAAYGTTAHYDSIKSKLGDPNEVLHNGDLVRLVGETIQQRILAEKATPANAPHGKILDALANAAPEFWKATATADAVPADYADLTEGRLVSFFSRIDDLTAEQTALDTGRWGNFLLTLAGHAKVECPGTVEYALAGALHRHFPHDLRQHLKHAFATGDEAYAEMQFRLFESLRGGIGDLSAKMEIIVAVLNGQTEKLEVLLAELQGQSDKLDVQSAKLAALQELFTKLQEQLAIKDRHIKFLQGLMANAQRQPQAAQTISPQAQAIADLLPDTGDAFDRALKAIAEKRFDDARQLLDALILTAEAASVLLPIKDENYTTQLEKLYLERGYLECYDQDYRAATVWFQKAVVLQPDDKSLLHWLNFLYGRSEDYANAINTTKKILDGIVQRDGVKSPPAAQWMNELANLYRLQRMYDDAETLFAQSLVSHEQVTGEMHRWTADTLHNFGLLRFDQRQYEEAEALLRRAYAIRVAELDMTHPHTQETADVLTTLCSLKPS